MRKYSAFIIEDEINNLNLLKHFLNKYCINIQIIGESQNITEGNDFIKKLKPEILFLDIRVEDQTIFQLLDSIDLNLHEIILITAHSDFALKAFRYNVVDYLLKPLSIEDLLTSVNRVIKRIEEKELFESKLFQNQKNISQNINKQLTISSLDKIEIIKKDEILFCKSDGRYTTFYLKNNKEIVACKNIGEYEQILIENNFFRVHHSYIINLDFVININKKDGFYCLMYNNAMIPVAKRRQDSLKKFLNMKINE